MSMNDEGARRLCAAIVECAAKDYTSALYRFGRNPNNHQAKWRADECERFLIRYSDYYCGIDGKSIVRRIQEEVNKRLEEPHAKGRTVGRKSKKEGISKCIP